MTPLSVFCTGMTRSGCTQIKRRVRMRHNTLPLEEVVEEEGSERDRVTLKEEDVLKNSE